MRRDFQIPIATDEGDDIAFPDIAERVYMVREMVGQADPVRDPIGGDLDDFRRTRREIDRLLDQGFERIIRIARGPTSR